MATVEQTPGELNFEVSSGDDFSYLFDFDINLTSYTFAASVTKPNGTIQAFTIAETSLSAGQITLSLTDSQVTALAGYNSWHLSWTISGQTRKVLAGKFAVK
jgi:hypothetical protein